MNLGIYGKAIGAAALAALAGIGAYVTSLPTVEAFTWFGLIKAAIAPAVGGGFGAYQVTDPRVRAAAPNPNELSMRPWTMVASLVVVFFMVMSSGCGVLGYGKGTPKIDTSNKTILVSTAELKSAVLLLEEVIPTGLLSRKDAQKSLDVIKESAQGLHNGATAINQTGDPLQASSSIEKAGQGFAIVMRILAPYVNALPKSSITGVQYILIDKPVDLLEYLEGTQRQIDYAYSYTGVSI